jgi:putative membrane protein
MTGFILRALIAALGLWLATEWVTGVTIDTPTTLIIAGVLLGIVNAIVRPLAVILTFPITLVTLGSCPAFTSRVSGLPSGPH